VAHLKKDIENQFGYLAEAKCILHEGKKLNDCFQLQNYISKNTTIALNLRL